MGTRSIGSTRSTTGVTAWKRDSGQSQVSGQNTAYLSGLAISSRRRDRRWVQVILALRRQGWSAPGRVVRQDPPADVAPPFRVLVVHVVAGLAVIAVARVASREHVLGAAQGALSHVRLARGCLCLRSGRELDDLVIGITTVSGEGRRWDLRGCRRPALLMLHLPLLLLRLSSEEEH